jgi:hypothetical protein
VGRLVPIRLDSHRLHARLERDAVVTASGWGQAGRLGEDVAKPRQEFLEQGVAIRGGAGPVHAWCWNARPAYGAPHVLERDGARDKVLDQLAQGGHPVGSQDEVVTCKGHDKQIDGEAKVIDGERGLTKNAWAWYFLAVGDGGRQARAGLDGQPCPRASRPPR